MPQIFPFKQENRHNWETTTTRLNQFVFNIKKQLKIDFEIEIREKKKKRSGQQLKAFWVLIDKVRRWMNEQGNCFSAAEVAAYFKIEAGHYSQINNRIVPKDIDNKSNCTIEDMERIIHAVIEFGAKNLINDCYIEPEELKELLNYYLT